MTTASEQHEKYWQYEYDVASGYMIPLLQRWGIPVDGADVIDVGCGEGGGLCAMYDRGARCGGFDIEAGRVRVAGELKKERTIVFTVGSLFDAAPPLMDHQYDLVVLHDVFEHLDHKEDVLRTLMAYAKPDGHIMITFPPYYSAYGAHQQLLTQPAARIPFFHLIPLALTWFLPRLKGEEPYFVNEVRKLGRLKMGMGKFERIVASTGLIVAHREAYLISPNHIRFGLKPIPAGPLASIPLIRELLCSGAVYLLSRQRHAV